MNELIKIETLADGKNVVSARELHAFLEVKETFAKWIKYRIEQYDLTELVDYQFLGNFPQNPQVGRPTIEYALTIETAKELSMVENNAKGKIARKYFLACERNFKELQLSTTPAMHIAELAEIKQQLAELKASHSAEMAEIKALLKPRVRQIKAMSEQKIEALAAINDFWEVLNRFPLDRDYWDTDTFACMLYVRTSKAYRHYADHGAQCGIKLLSQQDIYRILSDGEYSPFTPSTQKGDSHTVARHGLGRSHQFRYELRDNEMFVGDKKITFARKR